MKVTLLGTGGFFPNNQRQTNCLWIPENIVIDAGTGISRLSDLDNLNIFLTHSHLDHICGLPYLYNKNITLYCRDQDWDYITKSIFSSNGFPPSCEFKHYTVNDNDSFQLEDWTISTRYQEKHAGGSVGYKFTSNKFSFAYITDTEIDFNGVDFCKNVDVLFHECYYLDNVKEINGHSTPTQVANFAKLANAKKLVLIHINPYLNFFKLQQTLKSANLIFDNTYLAEDYQCFG